MHTLASTWPIPCPSVTPQGPDINSKCYEWFILQLLWNKSWWKWATGEFLASKKQQYLYHYWKTASWKGGVAGVFLRSSCRNTEIQEVKEVNG